MILVSTRYLMVLLMVSAVFGAGCVVDYTPKISETDTITLLKNITQTFSVTMILPTPAKGTYTWRLLDTTKSEVEVLTEAGNAAYALTKSDALPFDGYLEVSSGMDTHYWRLLYKSITVTCPPDDNGVWKMCYAHNITWTSTGIPGDHLKIELYYEGKWYTINGYADNMGSQYWYVGDAPWRDIINNTCYDCYIKITSVENPSVTTIGGRFTLADC